MRPSALVLLVLLKRTGHPPFRGLRTRVWDDVCGANKDVENEDVEEAWRRSYRVLGGDSLW